MIRIHSNINSFNYKGKIKMNEYLAIIKMFAGKFSPQGFVFCEGQTLQIQQKTALFSIIGTTYGGDGISTFNLPDLRELDSEGRRYWDRHMPRYIICVEGLSAFSG